MISFATEIQKFEKQGEKTGWTYIDVPGDIAHQLMPGNKKSFRVKGFLDAFSIGGVALLPMGEGAFILPLNAAMRKGIGKREGAIVSVQLECDTDYQLKPPVELEEFFLEDEEARSYFLSLAKSHRDYFIKWIESAKTLPTREKRLVETAKALSGKKSYSEMIRAQKMVR